MTVKIKTVAVIVTLWTLLVILTAYIFHRRKITYLREENTYILEWISNRHGKEWAERIKEWSHYKTRKNIPPVITEEEEKKEITRL